MQLIIPPGETDFRKYSYFFDAAANTDFTTVDGLIQVLRNVRTTPRSLSGDQATMHEMMGVTTVGSSQRLYLTRIGCSGGPFDFSSTQKFVDTFLPTSLGTGQRTANAASIDPPVAGPSSQQVFPSPGGNYVQGMSCLSPTKVGQNTIGQVSYAFADTTSYIASAGIQRSGSIGQTRQDIRTSTATGLTSRTLISWDSSTSRVGLYLVMTQALAADQVGFNWSAYLSGDTRAGPALKVTASDPNVPYYQATLTPESDIVLAKGLILIANGSNLLVVKLASADFSFPATTPGQPCSGTIAALPQIVSAQRTFTL